MMPGSLPPGQPPADRGAGNEARLRALLVLVEVDDVLDDLCWWLLDLYEVPSRPSPAREGDAGA